MSLVGEQAHAPFAEMPSGNGPRDRVMESSHMHVKVLAQNWCQLCSLYVVQHTVTCSSRHLLGDMHGA